MACTPSSTLSCLCFPHLPCKVMWFFFFPYFLWSYIYIYIYIYMSSGRREGGLDPCLGKIPWRRRPGIPLQYSCLENPMNRGAWQATVHRVAQRHTQLKQLSTLTHCLLLSFLLQEYSMTQFMWFYAFS